MATIAWTDEARRWLEDIFEYIAADNPHAAARTVQEIYERAQVLAGFPEPDMATLKAWYHSPEYQPLIALRRGAATDVLIAIEGT